MRSSLGVVTVTLVLTFGLGVSAFAAGTIDSLTITTARGTGKVWANDTSEYKITLQSTYGGSITDMRVMLYNNVFLDQPNARGYLCWGLTDTDITRYGGTWQIMGNATGGGRWGYMTSGYGSDTYISPVSCSTSISGNQRTVEFFIRFKPTYGALNAFDQDIAGFSSNAGGNTNWQEVAPNTYEVPSSYFKIDSLTISAPQLMPDNTQQYTVTLKATHPDGVTTYVRDMRVLFNNWAIPRGYLAWGQADSDITYFGQTWTTAACSGGGRWGYCTDHGGATDYITPVSASTSVSGNQRTVSFVIRVKESYLGETDQDLGGWATESPTYPYGTSWVYWNDPYDVLGPRFYPTGVDDSYTVIAAGAQDPHWTLTASDDPSYPGPAAYATTTIPSPPWVANDTYSKWLSPRSDETITDGGGYVYSTSFDLTGYDPTAVSIRGQILGDDQISWTKVNGTTVAAATGTGFNAWADFEIAPGEGFITGVNTVDIRAYSLYYGPGGFRLNARLQAPYRGTAWSIPGRIELEDFDIGGKYIAWYDATAGNSAGFDYRPGDVDVAGSGAPAATLAYMGDGDWTEYTIDVADAGVYDVDLRYASGTPTGGALRFWIDGVDVTGSFSVPYTGGWGSFVTTTLAQVSLSAGVHILRFEVEVDNTANADWIELNCTDPDPPTGDFTTADDIDQITWGWSNPTGTGYVYKGYSTSTGGSAVWTTAIDANTYPETGLSPNTHYDRYVATSNTCGSESSRLHLDTYTLIEQPSTPAATAAGTTTIDLAVTGCSNITAGSSGVYFAPTQAEGTAFSTGVRGQNPYRMLSATAANSLWDLTIGSSGRGLAGGLDADTYDWRDINSGSNWGSGGEEFTTLEFLVLARDHDVWPLLTANLFGGGYIDTGDGTFICQTDNPDGLAADWVRYTNIILQNYRQGDEASLTGENLRVYNDITGWESNAKLLAPGDPAVSPVMYWEIGNEPELGGFPGFLSNHYMNASDYHDRYKLMTEAMLAVDPTIKVGPCIINPPDTSGSGLWIDALASDPTVQVDFISYHPYYYSIQNGWGSTGSLTTALRGYKAFLVSKADGARTIMDSYGRTGYQLIASEWNPLSWDATSAMQRSMSMALGVVEGVFTFAEDDVEAAHFWEQAQAKPAASAMYSALRDYMGDTLVATTEDLGSTPASVDWRVYITVDSANPNRLVVWGLNFHESQVANINLDLSAMVSGVTSATLRSYGIPGGDTSLMSYSGLGWETQDITGTFDPTNFTFALDDAEVTLLVLEMDAPGGIEEWVQSLSDTATGLTPNTRYRFQATARNGDAVETNWTAAVSRYTRIETPAVPVLTVNSTSEIAMNTAGLSKLTLGNSGAYFDSTTTGGDGGINAWLQVLSDTATSLAENTQYAFRAKARNAESLETTWSGSASAYTLIATPSAPSTNVLDTDRIALSVPTAANLAAGASGLFFECTSGSTSGIDTWVKSLSDTAEGLTANTEYTFRVKARNGDAVETGYSGTVTAWTRSVPPSASNITADRSYACTGNTVTWTALDGFGPGQVAYYRYAWDQNPTHTWTDTEPPWTAGSLPTVPAASGTWYLHLKGYNGNDVGNGTYDAALDVYAHVDADFDNDCDVDGDDLAHLLSCDLGPAIPQASTSCQNADLDNDGDVDQADLGLWQPCFGGTNQPPAPDCGN